MVAKCSNCQKPGNTIVASIELSHGDCDERTLDLIFCPRCNFRRIGVSSEKRWGPLGDESSKYYQEECSQEAWDELKRLISLCPKPDNYQCSCLTHKKLDVYKSGSWYGLEEFLKSYRKKYREKIKKESSTSKSDDMDDIIYYF